MDKTKFQFQCTKKDWQAFRKKGTPRQIKHLKIKPLWLRLSIVAAMLSGLLLIWWVAGFYFYEPVLLVIEAGFIWGVVVIFIWIVLENRCLTKYRIPYPYDPVICTYDDESIEMAKNGLSTRILWGKICNVDLVSDTCFIWIYPLQAWIVPINDDTRPHIEKIEKIWQSAKSDEGVV